MSQDGIRVNGSKPAIKSEMNFHCDQGLNCTGFMDLYGCLNNSNRIFEVNK